MHGNKRLNDFAVLDQGSSSSRALAISPEGEVLAKFQVPLRADFPKEGWAEYDAYALLKSQTAALDELLASGQAPCAIGITAQRSTVVLWDADDGRPLCPALSWQDGRAAAEITALPLSNEQLHSITGLYKTPYYSAPKIAWCVNNFPAVKQAAARGVLRIGPVASYIIWHLTGGKVFAADPTFAQRMLLFDINSFAWDKRLLDGFGVDADCLPELRPSAGDFGDYKGIPITAVCGDQQSAMAGAGAFERGQCVLNYGTGAFLLANTGGKFFDIPGLLASVLWQAGEEKGYLLEGTVNSASSTLDWLNALGLEFKAEELDALCAKSQNPPLMLAALGGLGSPHWDYKTQTTITGLNARTRKEDLVRGALESLAYLISDIALLINGRGVPISQIRASGGLSKCRWLLQFQADLLQTPVARLPETETTALGAAYLMAARRGIAAQNWPVFKPSEIISPRMGKDEAQTRLARWRAFFAAARELTAKTIGQ